MRVPQWSKSSSWVNHLLMQHDADLCMFSRASTRHSLKTERPSNNHHGFHTERDNALFSGSGRVL